MVMYRARSDYIESAEMNKGQQDNDATLKWAEQQYTRALHKLNRISPVTSLASLQQGDVMVSGSGNIRVVLKIEKRGAGPMLTFLSRLKSGRVTLESALLQKVDMNKLEALVRRRSGNPLEKFAEVARGLETERGVFHNVKVLLQSGVLGGQVRSALNLLKKAGEVYAEVDLWVSAVSGEIEQIGGDEPNAPCRAVAMSFNCLGLPSDEYIKSARFDRETDPAIKKNILAAAVLANTLENARNLMVMAKTAGL